MTTQQPSFWAISAWSREVQPRLLAEVSSVFVSPSRAPSFASKDLVCRHSATMPNMLKDLISMVSPQAKRPLQSPSTTNRLAPAKQNVASGPFADFAARIEDATGTATVEQQQEQAKMDAFVFMNLLR